MTVPGPLLRLHRLLLPQKDYIGWTPYIWLVYLAFFVAPLFDPASSLRTRAAGAACLVAFLALYFRGYWSRGKEAAAIMAGIVLLGVALLPSNQGAAVFFIYAGTFSSNVGPPRAGVKALAAVLLVFLVDGLLLGVPANLVASLLVISLLVGLVNIYYAEMGRKRNALHVSEEERARLAVTAERERIARDLHDLLGHTLSVIALKSELALRLLPKDPDRAAREIGDVEAISREALAQVREAVTGYRTSNLPAELANARALLQAADVRHELAVTGPPLPAEVDAVLAMIVREAVTNVVRHAAAARCEVNVISRPDAVTLRVFDDGKGGAFRERSGLTGMRERAASRGGSVEIRTGSGTELLVTIPLGTAGRRVPGEKDVRGEESA